MNIVIDGRTFKSSHALVYGDYVGAGSVGVANVRWLEENRRTLTLTYRADPQYSAERALEAQHILPEDIAAAGAVILRGDHGYHAGFILTGVPEGASEDDEVLAEDGRDVLDAIENYCVLDEEFLYEIEEEWRQERLTEIWKYDAPRALAKLDAEAGEFVDNMTEGEFGIMWYEAVELPDLVEWIYEENQAVPDGLNNAIPALLGWVRDRFAELEQQAGTLGWTVIPESPDDLATTEWGYASPGGTPDKWFAYRWQALEAAASDTSFRDVQPRLI
ncbi:MAG: hypothetical protein JSR83_01900 [Proteobacteria bacterium]|nr:hypothetical protein [Pseudomonadota bacterium]